MEHEMNERIEELVGQAKFMAEEILNKQISKNAELDAFAEKFAELIVAECISVIDDAERGGSNEIWDNAVKFIRKDIKQHFGVEE
jgi:hypothetical protein